MLQCILKKNQPHIYKQSKSLSYWNIPNWNLFKTLYNFALLKHELQRWFQIIFSQWVYNILNKETEADRIIFEDTCPDSGFILLPDMKWDRKDMNALYLQALVHRRDILSIRDLDQSHLPLLKNILEKGLVSTPPCIQWTKLLV